MWCGQISCAAVKISLKNYPNLTFNMFNSMVYISLHVSWFYLTTWLTLKNYPNLTCNMFNSMVYISIYSNFTFMSGDLYSYTADLIDLEKLPLFDLWYIQFHGVYLNSKQFYIHAIHSWFDLTTWLTLKSYPNFTFNMLNSMVYISI